MQTIIEWMEAHNYRCGLAMEFGAGFTDVADCFDRSTNIDMLLIGLWEHAMDSLWSGGREYLEAWIADVQVAYPELVPGDLWPLGALPDNAGRFEYYAPVREFAKGVIAACVDARYGVTVEADLCDRLRLAIPGNPMSNAA